MSKKVAVPDEETVEQNGGIKAKKKRGCCCSCCLVALIAGLVIFLAAFITGWILGDKFTKQYLDMSLGDVFGVVGDLYWTDDDDVVTRKYSNKDLNGFYNEIKRNILLKDSAEVDFDSALTAAIDKYIGGETAKALNASAEGGDNGEKESDSEITDILVDMIVGVLNRDNIDIERLNSYPETDEYIFNLNDKQLAAFVNSVLKKVLKSANKMDSLKDVSDMVKLDTIVSLKQIRFTANNDKETGEVKASSAEITIWLGLQSAANQAIKYYMNEFGQAWAAGIVGWFGDVLLPENLYLTVSLPLLGEDNKAEIKINAMNKAERARANKLINGILKLSGGENAKTLQDIIDEFAGEIVPMLESATEKMDFTNASKGTISLDLLDTVAKMASEDSDEAEKLTKDDFLFVLQALLSDTTEQLSRLTPYRYDNWYMVNGSPKYLATGGNPADRIDYEQLFVEEIENAYAISFGADKNLTSVLEMLGISLDGSSEANKGSTDLLDRLDSAKFDDLVENTSDDVRLYITDRMLGAALSEQVGKLTDDGGMENLSFTLEAMTFVKKEGVDDHIYAMLAVQADLSGLIESLAGDKESLVGRLVTGLMPESILLTITVDITRGIDSSQRDKPEYIINSCYNTDRALATLEKLAPDLNLDSIADDIAKVLTEMLDQLENTLGAEVIPSTYLHDAEQNAWLGEGASLVLPDIFTVICDMVLVDENNQPVVEPHQLRHVIRDLNNPAVFDQQEDGGYDDFIDQVFQKYYLKAPDEEQGEQKVTNFAQLTAYMSGFSTSKLRIEGNDGLAHDKTEITQLKPIMGDDELLSLLKDNMGGNDNISSYSIVRVETSADEETEHGLLSLTLSIPLDKLLSGAGKIREMIKADTMFVTVTFDTEEIIGSGEEGDPKGYSSTLYIEVQKQGENDVMDDDTLDAMFRLVRLFAKDFDIEKQVDDFGVILYNQMENLNESMGGTPEHRFITFTEDGMQLTDFYSFLALKLDPTLLNDGYTGEDIKKTIQGLYAYDETENDYNFDKQAILYNEPDEKGSSPWTPQDILQMNNTPHNDKEFNGFLKSGLESVAEGVVVEQTIILAKTDDDDRDDVDLVRAWLNDKLGLTEEDAIDNAHDYMVVTFSMGMDKYLGSTATDNKSTSLFPTRIYATVVYKFDSAIGQFSMIGSADSTSPKLVFNNMGDAQYNIMVRMMGMPSDADTSDTVSINDIAALGATVLNRLTEGGASITFAPLSEGDSGMGSITINT